MQSAKCAGEPKVPELSDSDIQWLEKTIGIRNLYDDKWKSMDHARAVEDHLEKNVECRLNAKNTDGNTPLHLVAISENYAAIEGLLMCGADVNATNKFGQTPITYSQHCPDYSVGFQFFRHLHKLAYLRQHINEENDKWYRNVRQTFNQRYLRDRYIAAFTHNPSLTQETILDIRAGGEIAMYQKYKEELQRIPYVRINKKRTLNTILDVTDRLDVPENYLKKLRKYMKCPYFRRTFPLFGFIFKQKYRQSLEHLNNRQHGNEDPCNLAEESNNESVNAAGGQRVTGTHYAKNLRNGTEQRTKEFMAREHSVNAKLMSRSKKTDRRNAADVCSLSERNELVDVHCKVNHSNGEESKSSELSSSDEKLEKMRQMLAKLPRPGLNS